MRQVDVFFYGLFMDAELLRDRGIEPRNVERATLADFALRIGQRATLVPAPGGRVHGLVYSLTLSQLAHLYSEPSVSGYQPQAVLAHLESGAVIPALCYILPQPPAPNERNPNYAVKLRALAIKIGLPAEYVASIK